MLAEQRQAIADLIREALATLCAVPPQVELQRPKVPAHGDLSCTVALQLAKQLGRPARALATELAQALRASPRAARWIESIEVAGPGFLNLRLTNELKQQVLGEVLRAGHAFGSGNDGGHRPVLIEFVSANPTGPLHLGHARQAALGDTLANVLAARGWDVQREFYYNDAGVQIEQLTRSVQARAQQLLGRQIDESQIGYQGDYIVDIAREFLAGASVCARDGAQVSASGDPDDALAVRRFAVASLRHQQDLDLEAIGVRFDHFYLESSLYEDGRVEAAVQGLIQSGLTFSSEGALWLRTTQAGVGDDAATLADDKDRVVRKSDGTYTYFVPDVAYHLAKFERGYTRAINVQGSDHHGTVARVRAGLQILARTLELSIPPGYPEYLLHKMVRVMRGGEEVKMSKRAGTYVALRDLVDWVGRDATRFFLVSRKSDSEFAFDVDLALSHSEDNPVYYVQYAHARICSVLAQAAEHTDAPLDESAALLVDPAPLVATRELALLARLAEYPDTLRDAAGELAPHQVAFYLRELAADLHAFYNAERILVDDPSLRAARLALLLATRQVLRNGLALIGVSAPDRM
ncbi:Arginine--tRNA ligase [Burkholderiales bacterium]|nr:Arginine--tRNA ligase [Burkholderiales bacterium]